MMPCGKPQGWPTKNKNVIRNFFIVAFLFEEKGNYKEISYDIFIFRNTSLILRTYPVTFYVWEKMFV